MLSVLGRLFELAAWLAAALIGLIVIFGPPSGPWPGAVALLCSAAVALVIHEAAHMLVGRFAGVRVTAIYLGSPPGLLTFRLGDVRLSLGLRLRGRVVWQDRSASGWRAAGIAAGPLANLVTAPALLVLPVPHWVAVSFALTSGGMGAASLFPFRMRSGRLTDGAALLQAPARSRAEADLRRLMQQPDWVTRADAAERMLTAYRLGVGAARDRFALLAHLLRKAGWLEDLLDIHASTMNLADAPSENVLAAIHNLEWEVLTVPGLEPAVADLAAHRVQWVISHETTPQLGVQNTLALARLRQGRPAEVEPLCAADLAADLQPGQRATILATVALARRALGQDAEEPLTQALALDPAADLVGEASSAISAHHGSS
jgi:hypothetical protein